ncbi:MAG: protein kinase domain-containing protein [Polyangiales bacterium]
MRAATVSQIREVSSEPEAQATASPPVLGRYRLCFEIASGGMATVYLAHQRGAAGIGRLVALKRIHPHLAQEREFVEMFLDEARIASQIQHPNICSVLDFGEAQGTYYLTMEYLMGEPLAHVQRAVARDAKLREQARSFSIVASIIAKACEGLHAAHELCDDHGEPLHVVHRDVSPQNIYLTYHGEVRVVDFGIASARNSIHHTKTGNVKGKFAYMAPEQMRGLPVDRRADVWSLGVVLWETLALKRLFKRHSESETVLAVVQSPIPMLRDIRPEVPEALAQIAHKALSRNRDDRYPTARALARDLMRYIASTDSAIDHIDRAEWMEALFPGGRERQQQLVQIAAQLGQAVPKLSEDGAHPRRSSESLSMAYEVPQGMPVVGPSLPAARSRRWRWLPWVAGLGAGAVAALLVWYAQQVGWSAHAKPHAHRQPSAHPSVDAPELVQTQRRAPRLPQASTATQDKNVTAAKPPAAPRSVPASAQPSATNAVPTSKTVAPSPSTPPKTLPRRRAGPSKVRARSAGRSAAAAPSSQARKAANDTPSSSAQAGAPASPKPVGKGYVSIATPGAWADIYLGGRKLGQSPGRFRLPAGAHRLRLQPFGKGKARFVTVEVAAGEEARLRVPIK